MRNHEQCKEEIIELLTEDDEEYNKKVEILKRHRDLLTGDLFGELTFIVITARQNIEKLISVLSANEDDSIVELIKEAFVMYSNHYRPWEVKFSLET